MSRLPIRLRLTAAFALAMVAVLVGAGAFVYARLDSDLTEAVDDALEARATSPGLAPLGLAAPSEADEGFAQIFKRGRMAAQVGGATRPVLSAAEIERALEGPLVLERDVAGVDGETRILALPAESGDDAILVVGQSLEDRDESLASVVASFAIGGPIAVVLASLLGYALASAGFRPVEAMRRRAEGVSFEHGAEPLPLPAARDEIHRLGETLNEMLARLRASFERERRFVDDASHELRSPIAVIKAELDNALRSSRIDGETREALVSASEECDRLAHLADDLLVLARSGNGGLPVRPETVLVRDALEDARTRFASRAAERGREIAVEVEGAPMIEVDPLRLRQALSNLIDNALRYGAGDVSLRARESGDSVAIEVADEGSGFSPELADRAFERFTREDAARGRGGAGLGLAIVRAICEAHGGTADIVPGAGGTVRLRMPAASLPLSGSSQT
jgi:signal transduction histidine kinase